MTASRRPWIVLVLAFAASFFALSLQTSRVRAGRADETAARAALRASEADLGELLVLTSAEAVVSTGVTPSHTILAKINAALEHAGLPRQLATDIVPGAVVDGEETGSGVRRRQAVRLTLSKVRPTDVGGFLAAWQEREPLWSVTRIDLVHAEGRGDREAGRYDATIGLQTTYVSFE